MEATPSKFQCIIIPHGLTAVPASFKVTNMEIPIDANVKIQGIFKFTDNDLNFAGHFEEICIKDTRQLHVIWPFPEYKDILMKNVNVVYSIHS